MIEIAKSEDGVGVFQKEIAKNQGISLKYLDHIIHALKADGLITNVKGKKSGYILTRKASDITIYDIHNAFENGICVIECQTFDFKCEMMDSCLSRNFWHGLNEIIVDYFKSTTLLDLVNSPDKKI
jgi:Rrf2 family protein